MKKIISLVMSSLLMFSSLFSTNAIYAEEGEPQVKYVTNEHYQSKSLNITFYTPADDSIDGWKTQSLPMANGYMGISMFGGTDYERLQITEQSMYTASSSYKESRASGQESFGDLFIDVGHHFQDVSNYKRYLSLNNAIAYTEYSYKGVEYKREYFSSYPDKVSVVKFSASKEGKISLKVRPEIAYERDAIDWPGIQTPTGKHGTVVADGDTITLSGHSEYFGIDFEGQFKVIIPDKSGTLSFENGTDEKGNADNGTITVTGANECYIVYAVGTNHILEPKTFEYIDSTKRLEGNPHPHDKVTKYLEDASKQDYDTLKSRHLADYKEFFDRNVFDIGGVEDNRTTAELIKSHKEGNEEKYLEEVYYQFGRYMLIATSRKGCLPANLQGMWNAYDVPPWTNGFWYNVNQQMNYWPAFVTNLEEMYESYFDFNEARLPRARERADDYIRDNHPDRLGEKGTNGWIVGTGNSAFNVGGVSSTGHSGPGTGGFTIISDIDYYRFTKDKDVIKKIYPVIEDLSRFYSKVVDNYNGTYLVTLSASPEQRDKVTNEYVRTTGCAFDQQMVYETNKAVVDMYDEFKDILPDADKELVEALRKQLDSYEHVLIGYSGQIKEFREEDFYGDIGEYNHRHISHLVGLYPGNSINDDTPHWLDGARVTMRERGIDDNTGWASAHKMELYARCGDGEMSYFMFRDMLSRHTYDNLWDCIGIVGSNSNDYFQVEGNFGVVAGVAEMLLQSQGEYIEILPALTSSWKDGTFKGLVARGNFDISASWKNMVATDIRIVSNAGEKLKLNYPNITKATFTNQKGEKVSFTAKDKDRVEIDTKIGDVITVTDIPYFGVTQDITEVYAKKDGYKTVISWDKSNDRLPSYNVYRAFESEPDYELIATLDGKTNYTDLNRDGRQATYKVCAVSPDKEESLGKMVTVIPDVKKVQGLVAYVVDTDAIQVQWEDTPNAKAYRIYEKKKDGYELVAQTEDKIYVIENVNASKKYAISALLYDEESEKTDIRPISGVSVVSKRELFKLIPKINNLITRSYVDADISGLVSDADKVNSIWKNTLVTEEDVSEALKICDSIINTTSGFKYNILKDNVGKIVQGNLELFDNKSVDLMTDGMETSRFRSKENTKLVIEYELDGYKTPQSIRFVEYCESLERSRSERAVIEGLDKDGNWIQIDNINFLDYETKSSRRIHDKAVTSVPVNKIRVTITDEGYLKGGFSVWELIVLGTDK